MAGKSPRTRAGHGGARSAEVRARQRRAGRIPWVAIVVVVVLGAAWAIAARSGSGTAAVRSPVPAPLLAKVTSIPASVSAEVGAGTSTRLPDRIDGAALTTDGMPRVIYIGAEYCPYCAAERWAVVVALSRFGTFSGLSLTHSSGYDTFPNTNTFSFYRSAYSSRYLVFEPVELNTNQLASDGSYKKLETPTPEQQQLLATFDAPPYVSATSAGAIPFVDFGGKFLISGATYDAAVLQGKSADEIAGALSDPTAAIAQGVVGAANTMTAAMCTLTHDQPTSACANATIRQLEKRLG